MSVAYVLRALMVAISSLVATGCVSVSVATSASENEASTEAALLAVTEAYNAAWEELDYDKISAYHATEFTYLRRGIVDTDSSEDFERSFHENVATQITGYWADYSEVAIEILGRDGGLVALLYDGGVRLPDGTELPYDGALTYVWERRDSEWKLIHIHESESRPNAEPE